MTLQSATQPHEIDPAMQHAWAQYVAWSDSAWSNQPAGGQDVGKGSLGTLRAGGSGSGTSPFDSAKDNGKPGFGIGADTSGIVGWMDTTTKNGWKQVENWADHALNKAETAIGHGLETAGRVGMVGIAATASLITPQSDLMKPAANTNIAPETINPFAGISLPETIRQSDVVQDSSFNQSSSGEGFYTLGQLVPTMGVHGTMIDRQEWSRAA